MAAGALLSKGSDGARGAFSGGVVLLLDIDRTLTWLLFSLPSKFCPSHEEFPFLVHLSSRRIPSSLPRPFPTTASPCAHLFLPLPALDNVLRAAVTEGWWSLMGRAGLQGLLVQ